MAKANRLFFLALIAVTLLMPLVVAQSALENIAQTVFGFSGFGGGSETVVQLMIWLILFVAFADILELVFSDVTRWAIGFGLAVIAANVGIVSGMNVFLFSMAAGLGGFSVAAVISITFIAFLAAHFGLEWAVMWIKNARRMKSVREGTAKVAAGAEALAGVEYKFEKIGEEQRIKGILKWIIIIIGIIILLYFLSGKSI